MNGRLDPWRPKRGLPGPARLLPLLLALACAGGGGDEGASPAAALPGAPGPRTEPFDASRYAVVVHVSATGSDDANDGTAERPFGTIARAIEEAAARAGEGRAAVRVAEGTYAEPTLEMESGVDLFGGFEPDGWARDVFAHRTVLDGEGERRIVIAADGATIDGFVLARGAAAGKGGAILADGVSPRITNDVFEGNRTRAPEGWAPEQWHETANDGGAIACLNGCSAVVEHALFVGNETEIGRGAGFACDNEATKDVAATPRVASSVFLGNVASASRFGADTMRSGDGGAISFYGYCDGEIADNVVAGNTADSSNDGGGVFVALWSSPSVTGNAIVGNYGGDDAGGLFVGGQKHHYGTPKDPVPPAEAFFVLVAGNRLYGNRNAADASGGFRATMMSRGAFYNNVVAGSPVAAYTQRSEITLTNNTFVGDARNEDEERTAPGPTIWRNDLILGQRLFNAPVIDESAACDEPAFVDDGRVVEPASATADPARHVTRVEWDPAGDDPGDLAGRIVSAGERWSVVRASGEGWFEAWGDLADAGPIRIEPTYHLTPGSPCVDRGVPVDAPERDIDGDPRTVGPAPDLGADEVTDAAPAGPAGGGEEAGEGGE